MKYCIDSADIQNVFQTNDLNSIKEVPFCSIQDTIETPPITMAIKGWKTQKFKAQFVQLKSEKELQIDRKTESDMLLLHFVSNGNTSLTYGTNKSYTMEKNTNTIFVLQNAEVNHFFNSNKHYEYFKVFIPFEYVFNLKEQYPELLKPIKKLLKGECPLLLHEQHYVTTPEMQQVIEQIKNCQLMGKTAPLYFDTKVQELFLLQLQQKDNQQCCNCARYQHYTDQINQAKDIIEKQFKNPPSIHELALAVGMSATLLKASFKLLFGTTIYGYIYEYRMGIARNLLKQTPYTIAEIAEQSGYEHASHFTTAFKRKFQISPAAYRKRSA